MRYRNFVNDSWELFNREIKGKRLYLFGLNKAKHLLRQMNQFGNVWEIEGIIDNDDQKWGKLCFDELSIDIISPDRLGSIKDEVIVLLCGSYCGEMAIQLEKMGVKNYYSEMHMNRSKELSRPVPTEIDSDIIKRVKDILYDDKSKSILDSVVEKRRAGFADYSDIAMRGSEYFVDEFWLPKANGVYIDGGGYDGDTIEEIFEWTKGDFRRIYTFEPQVDKANQIESKLWKYKDKVKLFRKGLWDREDIVGFTNGTDEISGRISKSNSFTISTVALDDVINEDVTFIKMDIEGAELKALYGATGIITKYKPEMAICIYHNVDDLWEIPFYVKQIVPEYKLSIRHCGMFHNGTILYARL